MGKVKIRIIIGEYIRRIEHSKGIGDKSLIRVRRGLGSRGKKERNIIIHSDSMNMRTS